MSRLQSLNSTERKYFDSPPEFNSFQRKKFFRLCSWSKKILESIKIPTNKSCFILMYGYFKSTSQFYSTDKFHSKDINFVLNKFGLSLDDIDIQGFSARSFYHYKGIILKKLGFRNYDSNARDELEKESDFLASKQIKPKKIFLSLINFLRHKQIEIPGYDTLNRAIAKSINKNEKKLLKNIDLHLSKKQKQLLESLLGITEDDKGKKAKKYKLTFLKKINHSTDAGKIKENIEQLKVLREIYTELEEFLDKINLSPGLIDYYACWAKKTDVYYLTRKHKNRMYLHLICFTIHQYFMLQDVLIDKMIKCVQSAKNSADNKRNQLAYELQYEQAIKEQELLLHTGKNINYINEMYEIYKSTVPVDIKIEQIGELLEELVKEQVNSCIEQVLFDLTEKNIKIQKKILLFDSLESESIKLQGRVSEIIKTINFNKKTSDKQLIEAIDYFRDCNGAINKKAPQGFLKKDEKDSLFDQNGKFRVSLYKILLFRALAHGIKAGTLNLTNSYRYKSFEEYLISKQFWIQNKDELLKKAGLEEFKNVKVVLEKYRKALSKQYDLTNMNIQNQTNQHIKFPENKKFVLSTPKQYEELEKDLSSEFPQQKYISLIEVLNTIEKCSNYVSSFKHHTQKYNREKPDNSLFYAGLMGYGCNIGHTKISQISEGITENELENTINWYFSIDNLNAANDKVLSFIKTLELPVIFKKNPYITHTSSDGQKYQVPRNVENANYSFKYFGKEKGISIYSYIDDSHLLFHSCVISSSEREAAYVIDGLLHNEVVKSDIHSTDTHGYTELVFGTLHLLDFVFAPRIKNLKSQQLYTFPEETIKSYKDKKYKILPTKYIKPNLIEEYWDDILRFIATIKLKETTASQLFKRLTSYSIQHPLYKALKSFGQIFKSLFILKYIDETELRQDIEKQLSKIENSHKFAKAVRVGNNNEFNYHTKEEQEIAASCNRLIRNCIICWNYLYLSEKLSESSEKELELLELIKSSSIVIWKHINCNGTYDFTGQKETSFDVPKILSWTPLKMVHDEMDDKHGAA